MSKDLNIDVVISSDRTQEERDALIAKLIEASPATLGPILRPMMTSSDLAHSAEVLELEAVLNEYFWEVASAISSRYNFTYGELL